MFHLFNTDLGGVRGTFGFFLSMATRGLRGDYEQILRARRGEYNDGLNDWSGEEPSSGLSCLRCR